MRQNRVFLSFILNTIMRWCFILIVLMSGSLFAAPVPKFKSKYLKKEDFVGEWDMTLNNFVIKCELKSDGTMYYFWYGGMMKCKWELSEDGSELEVKEHRQDNTYSGSWRVKFKPGTRTGHPTYAQEYPFKLEKPKKRP